MQRPIDGTDAYAVLLAELAGRLGLACLAPDASGTCAIRFGGTLTVNLRQGWSDPQALWLVCSLGPVEPDAATCLALLRTNLPWRQDAGTMLGISDETPPRILLSRALHWRGMDGATLAASLEAFVGVARAWAERLAGGAPPAMRAREQDHQAAWFRA